MEFVFDGVVTPQLGGSFVSINDESAFRGYLALNYSSGDEVELVVRPRSTKPKDKLFQYLYYKVYPALFQHLGISLEELDSRMKSMFLTVNKGTEHEYVRDKKNLKKEELFNFVEAVKGYAVTQGCEILD